METKENLLHLFWNCNLVKKNWFVVKNFLMISAINCKGDNSWNIRELQWESKYSK